MIKDNLLGVGRKFKVVEPSEDSAYGIGSVGFMSYPEKTDSSFMNLAQIRAVMIRRGKGGKERIESVRLYVPIFTIEAENFKKAMPEKNVRKRYLHIAPDGARIGDVMALSDIEYLGWAFCHIRTIRNFIEKCKHSQWPQPKSHPFNQLYRINEYYEEDPDRWKDKYAGSDNRAEFLNALRPMMSSLVRVGINESIKRAEMLLTAAEFLDFTNSGEFIPKDAKEKKNEFRFTEDENSLKLMVKKHEKLRNHFQKLAKKKASKKK